MSHPNSNTTTAAAPHVMDSLSDAFAAATTLSRSSSLDTDKPDSKPDPSFLYTASPISPLHRQPTTSTSSGSSGSLTPLRSHSGEILVSTNYNACNPTKPGHRRTGSGPLIFTGSTWTSSSSGPSTTSYSSTASSPLSNVLPTGNICPTGRASKPAPQPALRGPAILGSGTVNYGIGSIMRAHRSSQADVAASADPEEVRRLGNEQYKKGNFEEALKLYDKAIGMCPENAACRSNRAAALIGLRRIGEAVKECEEAVRLDPAFGRAHHRLASLHTR